MNLLPVSGLPLIEEEEAYGELSDLYAEIKDVLHMPYVPNIAKASAVSAPSLSIMIGVYRSFFEYLTLPEPLVAMISYCIPNAKNCTYCTANGELHCRSIGIEEDTLNQLARDLGNVNPIRVRTIIQFALKCAIEPQFLVADDYNQVRDQGVSDEELVEIIMIAAMANFSDTVADALKIEVDEVITQALAAM